VLQFTPHDVPSQAANPLVGTAHGWQELAPVPHDWVDVLLSQVPPQLWVPPGQPHPPPWHVMPLVHDVVQEPQYVFDVCTFVSQPFDWTESQLPEPLLHDATVQTPLVQAAVAFGSEHAAHAAPPVPQLAAVWLANP
jgi:hypothetical protein